MILIIYVNLGLHHIWFIQTSCRYLRLFIFEGNNHLDFYLNWTNSSKSFYGGDTMTPLASTGVKATLGRAGNCKPSVIRML